MKTLNTFRNKLLIGLLFLSSGFLFSQQFSINLNLLPPYSPFYRDYIG